MKHLLFLSLALLVRPLFSQEFEIYPNGLIYSERAVAQLAHTVDSLNLRFKNCGPAPAFRALPQTRGTYLLADSAAEQVFELLQANPSLEAVLQRFPQVRADRDLLVVRFEERGDSGQITADYRTYPEEYNIEMSHPHDDAKCGQVGSWVFCYFPKGRMRNPARLQLLYLSDSLQSRPLPELYTRHLQYVDCMIDTTSAVFYPEALTDELWEPKKKEVVPPVVDSFYNVMASRDDVEAGRAFLERDAAARQLLERAVAESIRLRRPDLQLEYYAGVLLDPKARLELMRCRVVYGYCSQDRSPRDHMLQIAQLAAETHSWDIFLRAHLDILNDNFRRAIDASYAWGQRGTYLRELEALGFDVPSLLIGACLRASNVADGHYVGYVGRIGRALAESADYDSVARTLEQAIADPQLDDYNRLLMWFLYHNLAHYRARNLAAADADQKALFDRVEAELKPVRELLPPYLGGR